MQGRIKNNGDPRQTNACNFDAESGAGGTNLKRDDAKLVYFAVFA